VFTLRCTQRLLARLARPPAEIGIEPTTHLGDWYANLLRVGRRQLVLAISERTFLPVVITAAPANTIVARLRVELVEILRTMSIEGAIIDVEVTAATTGASRFGALAATGRGAGRRRLRTMCGRVQRKPIRTVPTNAVKGATTR
jgi:hypothetical protein